MTTTDTTSRGSTSSSNGLLTVTIASSTHPHGLSANEDDDDLLVDPDDPFNITQTKNAPHQTLKRWRQAAFVLNASRRFRYTLDLKKEEEKEQKKSMIRAHALVIRAALLFRLAGERELVTRSTSVAPTTPGGDYAVGLEQLVSMSKNQNISALQQYGGVKGLSDFLKSDLDKGISGDDVDLSRRKSAFGTNTYPRKKGRSLWRFLWEAWQDLTLIILIIAAAVSLVLGIKTE
ncbi:calcium-transporting ATPase plasma membrane-type-like, partial [Trifolium medium]|nr:calcium-transporting ATPase plasma membrane-type-like [Trifolium medium]